MNVHEMPTHLLPKSDLGEIHYRIRQVERELGKIADDLSRQEIYDLVNEQEEILLDLAADINCIRHVLTAAADGTL